MKKIIMIATIGLCMLLPWTVVSFMDETTTATTTEKKSAAQEQGERDGKLAGDADGRIDGERDYRLKLNSRYSRNMMSYHMIRKTYRLSEVDGSYANYFIQTYRTAYRESYETAYRNLLMGEVLLPAANGFEHGKMVGSAVGNSLANVDYQNQLTNDWTRALTHYLASESLIDRFQLERESGAYRAQFEAGFKKGFSVSYLETFQERSVRTFVDNQNANLINNNQGGIIYSKDIYQVIEANKDVHAEEQAFVEYQPGTVYRPAYVSLFAVDNSFDASHTLYTPASEVFQFEVWGAAGAMDTLKPMVLSFDFTGSERVGIYKMHHGRWMYLPTMLTEDRVSTIIPAGSYRGGQYSLFIDPHYRTFSDIRYDFAQPEIFAFMRRGHVDDTNLRFRPADPVKRGEMAVMIHSIYKWADPLTKASRYISNYKELGGYKKAVQYCVTKHIMKLDDQDRFKMDDYLTYEELEEIISYLKKDIFSWKAFAQQMVRDRYYRSEGLSSNKAYVKRNEAVYLLFQME